MNKKNQTYVALVIMIIMFTGWYFLSTRTEMLTIKHLDKNNEVVNTEVFSTYPAQTMSLVSDLGLSFDTMAVAPLDQDTKEVLTATVINPYKESANLVSVKIYQDQTLLIEDDIGKTLEQNAKYIFTSDALKLNKQMNIKSIIKMEFNLTPSNPQSTRPSTLQTFTYTFASLKQCGTTADCRMAPFTVCDAENVARFSNEPMHYYCVQPCTGNGVCASGQICIKGRCGY